MRLRKKSIQTDELQEQWLGEIPSEEDDFEQKEIILNQLANEIEGLKEEQHLCIRLFFIEKKSYEQISQELNISLKQVKSAIQNGKRNLKIRLEENYESEE